MWGEMCMCIYLRQTDRQTENESIKSPGEQQAIVSCKIWVLGTEFGFLASTASIHSY